MVDAGALIGTPFEYGARGPHAYDCYGLLRELYARDGIDIPDYESPSDRSRIAALMAGELRLWRKLPGPQPGAAIVFRIVNLTHVGYCLDDDWFLHTWEKSGGVCRERLTHWERRIIGFYEYVG